MVGALPVRPSGAADAIEVGVCGLLALRVGMRPGLIRHVIIESFRIERMITRAADRMMTAIEARQDGSQTRRAVRMSTRYVWGEKNKKGMHVCVD
jgi:hypothetical protein